jgi:hypothetical protein
MENFCDWVHGVVRFVQCKFQIANISENGNEPEGLHDNYIYSCIIPTSFYKTNNIITSSRSLSPLINGIKFSKISALNITKFL